MRNTIVILLMLSCISAAAQQVEVNYDESKVGPYSLENPLMFANGKKVATKADWQARRAEIAGLFQKEMYGQIPPKSEIVCEVLESGDTQAGYGIRKQVRMWFRADKTGPKVDWLIILPKFAAKPVPAIMMLNYLGNQAMVQDPEVLTTDGWLRANKSRNIGEDNKCPETLRGYWTDPNRASTYPINMMLARGYAFVTACYGEISPDPDRAQYPDPAVRDKIAFGSGVFGLWGRRDESRTDNTTALGAWAWALMRGLDMLEKDEAIDATKVMVTGCSRLAKAALIAGAYDERFAVVAPVQTGGGGVPLAKRNFGENITTETSSFTHWYCKAYNKYAGKEDTMPFDQHLFLTLVAPRPLLVMGFDQPWFDTKGEFLSVQAASPVWDFLGAKGMPKVDWPDDYDTKAIGSQLGYVRRSREHGISAYDWTWMLDFADRNIKK